MLARMLGVARLNVATFEDVEHDSGATLQAMLIVIAVSIATGVGHSAGRRGRPAQGCGLRSAALIVVLGRVGTIGLVRRKQNPGNPGYPGRLGSVGSGNRVCTNSGNSEGLHLHSDSRVDY